MSEQMKRPEDIKCIGDLPPDVQMGYQVRIMRALMINLVLILKQPIAAYAEIKDITVEMHGPDNFTVTDRDTLESALPSRREISNMIQAEESWPNPFIVGNFDEAKRMANELLKILLELPQDVVLQT